MKINYFKRFVYRLPILSFDQISPIFEGKYDIFNNHDINSNLLRAAIKYASSDLNIEDSSILSDIKSRLSIAKYIIRAGSRATPFGLFSKIGESYLGSEVAVVQGESSILKYNGYKKLKSTKSNYVVMTNTFYKKDKIIYYIVQTSNGYETKNLLNSPILEYIVSITEKPIDFDTLADTLCMIWGRDNYKDIIALINNLVFQGLLVYVNDNTLDIEKTDCEVLKLSDELDGSVIIPFIDGSYPDVQVSIKSGSLVTIDSSAIEDLGKAIAFMAKINSASLTKDSINKYYEQYIEVFDYNLTSLMEVVDNIRGIGFPKHFTNSKDTQSAVTSPFYRMLFNKYLKDFSEELLLPEDLFNRILKNKDYNLVPSTFEVFFTQGYLEGRKLTLLLPAFASAPAGRSLGRFSHIDSDIGEIYVDLANLDADSNRDFQLVDLTYTHFNNNANNLAVHKKIHGLTLRLFNPSGTTQEIKLNEIYIKPEEGKLVFYHIGSGKRLKFRASSLLTLESAPEIVRFMLEMSEPESIDQLRFDWGQYFDAPFLPRVRYRDIVIWPKTWHIDKDILISGKIDRKRFTLIREKRKIDKYVWFGMEDQRLILDLDSDIAFNILDQNRSSLPFRFTEVIFDIDGRPQNLELLAFYNKYDPNYKISEKSNLTHSVLVDGSVNSNVHQIGGNWIYVKLYANSIFYDFIIAKIHLKYKDYSWFFIRFYDDRPHLRLRIKSQNYYSDLASLMNDMNELRQDGIIDFIKIDEYHPEIERYGGREKIDEAEAIFHRSSIMYADDLIGASKETRFLKIAITLLKLIRIIVRKDQVLKVTEEIYDMTRRNYESVAIKPLDRYVFEKIVEEISHMLEEDFDRDTYEHWSPYSIASFMHMHLNRCGVGSDQEIVYYKLIYKAFRTAVREHK